METPTTELAAVNILLEAIGSRQVNTLASNATPDVAAARAKLKHVSREFQIRGWSFNTEENYPLLPDGDGFVGIPGNLAKYTFTSRHASQKLTVRGTRVYDAKNHTYVFSTTVYMDVVIYLSLEELPEPARMFVVQRARRQFVASQLESETRTASASVDETTAWHSFLAWEDMNNPGDMQLDVNDDRAEAGLDQL